MKNPGIFKSFTSIKSYADKFTEIKNQILELELLLIDFNDIDKNLLVKLKYPNIKYELKKRAPAIPSSVTDRTAGHFNSKTAQTLVENQWLYTAEFFVSEHVFNSIRFQLQLEINFRKEYYLKSKFNELIDLYPRLETYNFIRDDYRQFINSLKDSLKIFYLFWLKKELDAFYNEYPIETFYKEANHVYVTITAEREHLQGFNRK